VNRAVVGSRGDFYAVSFCMVEPNPDRSERKSMLCRGAIWFESFVYSVVGAGAGLNATGVGWSKKT